MYFNKLAFLQMQEEMLKQAAVQQAIEEELLKQAALQHVIDSMLVESMYKQAGWKDSLAEYFGKYVRDPLETAYNYTRNKIGDINESIAQKISPYLPAVKPGAEVEKEIYGAAHAAKDLMDVSPEVTAATIEDLKRLALARRLAPYILGTGALLGAGGIGATGYGIYNALDEEPWYSDLF